MNSATDILDRFSDTFGIPRRTIEDVLTRLRFDSALMRPVTRGRRRPGVDAFTASELVNLVLAFGAVPAPGRKGLNARDTVRAARSAARHFEWEEGLPPVPANFFDGTRFDLRVKTLGVALDSILSDMVAGAWPERLKVRLRFDDGGGKTLLTVEDWPIRGQGQAPGIADRVSLTMVFHAPALYAAWTPSCRETSVFVTPAALPMIAETMRSSQT